MKRVHAKEDAGKRSLRHRFSLTSSCGCTNSFWCKTLGFRCVHWFRPLICFWFRVRSGTFNRTRDSGCDERPTGTFHWKGEVDIVAPRSELDCRERACSKRYGAWSLRRRLAARPSGTQWCNSTKTRGHQRLCKCGWAVPFQREGVPTTMPGVEVLRTMFVDLKGLPNRKHMDPLKGSLRGATGFRLLDNRTYGRSRVAAVG